MVDAIISTLLDQLISISLEEGREQMRLVVGIDQEVAKLKHNFLAIQAVLVDAEQRQFKEETVRLWLRQLKDESYDMEDLLDEWNTARLKLRIEGFDENAFVRQKKVCCFLLAASCFGYKQNFLQRRDIALKIKAINEKLDDIAKQKDMFNFNVIRSSDKSERMQSTSLIDVSEIRGRDEEKNTIKSKLLCESSEIQKSIQVISMVGMGGIGKTTLAQFAYNDKDVIESFDKRMWVCVSDPFDELRIAKAIIEALEGSVCNLGELNSLLERINASIAGNKFLLVLDDVWTEDYSKWEPFQYCLMNGVHGSKILVTTRKETVARMMESINIVSIKELSEHECWSLFKRFAFHGRSHSDCEQLEQIGKKIVGKCKGLPLAAKTIGSLLRFKRSREEWESILNSELWQLEEFQKGLLAPLLLSYNDLPPMIKRCFQYCSVYPKDSYLERDELIKLWMAQDYIGLEGNNKEMEMIGEEYFDYLATRSFFQEFVKDGEGIVMRCKMHDLVHDFAQFLTENECVAIEVDGEEEPLALINICREKLRHSMLVLGYEASFPVSIFKAKKLRSLFINNTLIQVSVSQVLQSLFDQLTCLRALRITTLMNAWDVKSTDKILKGIQKLIHLRYLRLVGLVTEELPETCCELFNLQILELEQCRSLKRLPQGIGKLVNLRHLTCDDSCLEYMPKGIERLTNLRTLSEFVVVSGAGKNDSKACSLEGLRYLNHLRGSLKIRGLGNVRDIDEPKIADLEKKKNLVRLEIDLDEEEGMEITEEIEATHLAICEALRPPLNLQELEIYRYKGKTSFPSWLISLTNLKKLILSSCTECENLPPLGKLPSLEILQIFGMYRVKRVGDEFLGMNNSDHVHAILSSSSSSSTSTVIAFPKLKNLSLMSMYEWEEWEFRKEDVTIMPQLKDLHISNCSKLKMLPDQLLWSTTLAELKIDDCPILQDRLIQIDEEYVQGGPR